MWTLLWALQLQVWHDLTFPGTCAHFHFHFDCTAVGHIAAGWATCRKQSALGLYTRCLAQCLSSGWQADWIHWEHVQAHQGHLWNELADALAKYGTRGLCVPEPPWQTPEFLQLEYAVPWLWSVKPLLLKDPSLPPLVNGWLIHRTSDPLSDVSSGSTTFAPPRPPEQHSAVTYVEGSIRVATANVLTLSETSGHGLSATGSRQLFLMQQFHNEGAHVVGVQETRHRHLLSQNNPWYHVFGHAATPAGQDGCQLWISRVLPLSDRRIPLRREHVALLLSQPDFLAVRIDHPDLRCLILTGHAPHSMHSESDSQDRKSVV